jgi:uncharacterized membrane protein YecN with MAPEG domain
MAFGIAIGYASNFVPEQYLLVLAVGLTAFTIAYLVIAHRSHDNNTWGDYGLQTLMLAVAAISASTPRLPSAFWTLVFFILGCVGMVLDIKRKG